MFRYVQNLKHKKYLINILNNMQWFQKSEVPAKIRKFLLIPSKFVFLNNKFYSVAVSVVTTKSKTSLTNDFIGENIVITDASGSLGKALAFRLGRLNATLAVWGENKETLEETVKLVKMVGGNIIPYVCDMSRRDDIYRTAEKTKRDIGKVTIVINNSDIACEKLLLDTPDYLLKRAFDANVMSHFWITKAFLPNMIEANRGHFVSISSMAGFMGIQKLTDYCAAKSATMSFLNALRIELEREGSKVKTTIVCPYFINGTGLNGKPKLRILKALNADEVADRTIQAIRKNEVMTFIPGWLRFAMLARWITPSFVSSLITKVLIQDPCPSETITKRVPRVTNTRRADQIMKFIRSMRPILIKNETTNKENKKKANK